MWACLKMGRDFISRIGMDVEGNGCDVFNVPRLRGQTKEKRHLQYGSDDFVWFGQCGLPESATQIPG
jgi:hypothetical protein